MQPHPCALGMPPHTLALISCCSRITMATRSSRLSLTSSCSAAAAAAWLWPCRPGMAAAAAAPAAPSANAAEAMSGSALTTLPPADPVARRLGGEPAAWPSPWPFCCCSGLEGDCACCWGDPHEECGLLADPGRAGPGEA